MSVIRGAVLKAIITLFVNFFSLDALVTVDSTLHGEQFEIWIGEASQPEKQEPGTRGGQEEIHLEICPCEELEQLPIEDPGLSNEVGATEELLQECDCQEELSLSSDWLEEDLGEESVECCEEEEPVPASKEEDVWECEEQTIFEEELLQECDCQEEQELLPKDAQVINLSDCGRKKLEAQLRECDCEEMGGIVLEDEISEHEASQSIGIGPYEEFLTEDAFEEALPIFRDEPVSSEPEYYWTQAPIGLEKQQEKSDLFVSGKHLEECPCREPQAPIQSVFSTSKKREKIRLSDKTEEECPCRQEEVQIESEVFIEVVECPQEVEGETPVEVDVWECEEVPILEEIEECPCSQEEDQIESEVFVEAVECPQEVEGETPVEVDVWECEEVPILEQIEECPCRQEKEAIESEVLSEIIECPFEPEEVAVPESDGWDCEEEEFPIEPEEELCPCQQEIPSLDKALSP